MTARAAPVTAVAGLAALAVAAGVPGLAQLCARFTAPEMLPGAWGLVGQCLPNGALATLLRSVAYFDGARSAGPWSVLAAWAIGGLLLTVAIRPRRPRRRA